MYCHFLVAILAIVSSLRVRAETVTTLAYDDYYDNAALPLNEVACSDGANGLETENTKFTTLGSLPHFPYVGGVYTVSHWNSAQCGACYAVTHKEKRIHILAVDAAKDGFIVSEAVMNALTDNHAVEFGRVDVSFVQVDRSACGL